MGIKESQEEHLSPEAMEKIKADVDQMIAKGEEERIEWNDRLERLEKALTDPKTEGMRDVLEKYIQETKRNLEMLYSEKDRERLTNSFIEDYKRQMRMKQYHDERAERVKTAQITKEQIIDVFVTAIEGGSNYWYYILDIPKEVERIMQTDELAFSEACGEYVLNGGTLAIYDVEEVDGMEDPENEYASDKPEPIGYITMDSLLDAISKVKKEYPEVYENIIMDEYDASDADVFFQIATMGEIVYG